MLVVFDEVVSLVLGGWGGVKSEPYRALVDVTVGVGAGRGFRLCWPAACGDVLDLVREQCGVKVALRLDTDHASKAAIGMAGAERLPVKTPGRLIAVGLDNVGPAVLQGFWLSEAELDARAASLARPAALPVD